MRSTRPFSILYRLFPLAISFRRDSHRWIVGGAPLARSADFHSRRATSLAHTIGRLGPTFIKLAQVFAGRSDIIPEPYLAALGRLTDQVPSIPLAQIESTILDAYGRPAGELFERWDATPLAAASLGQVHRARYRGREVVVKVLRPGVEQLVASDVVTARRLLDLADRLIPNPHVRGARAVLGEFAARIGDEMDFRQEAAYATEIRANFASNPRVAVPEIIPELTRQRVMVMEYMEGAKIDALAPWIAEGRIDPGAVVRTVMEVYIQMMLVDGLFHADPHPGNLLVARDGRIVILDFGLVVRVPRDVRLQLVQTVFATIRRDVDRVMDGFYALGVVLPGVEPPVVRELARTLLEIGHTRATMSERVELLTNAFVPGGELLANEVMATLYDFPVILPANLVYFARTAALIEGVGMRYDAHFNTITFSAPIVLRMRRQILASLRDAQGSTGLSWVDALGSAVTAAFGESIGGALMDAADAAIQVGRDVLVLAWSSVVTSLGTVAPVCDGGST